MVQRWREGHAHVFRFNIYAQVYGVGAVEVCWHPLVFVLSSRVERMPLSDLRRRPRGSPTRLLLHQCYARANATPESDQHASRSQGLFDWRAQQHVAI